MRRFLHTSLGVMVVVLVIGPAQSGDEPRSIVDKAVEAVGGADKLAKLKAATFTEKGTYYGMGEGLPYTGHYAVQWPGQFRMEISGFFTLVLDRDKGWKKSQDGTTDMSAEELANQKSEQRAGWVSSLIPLKGKGFNLSKLDDIKVKGKPAAGVLVTHKGYPDVKLYFDKKTGLLVKTQHRAKAPEQNFKDVTQDAFFSDYREVDGVKVPHKLLLERDGKKFVEAEVTDFQAKGKLDNSVFGRP